MQGSSVNNATLVKDFYTTLPANKTVLMTRDLVGWKNSEWRSQVSKHIQAGTPASGNFETYEVEGNPMLHWIQPNRIGGGYYGKQEKYWRAVGFPPYMVAGGGVASLSEATNQALTKLNQRITDATMPLQGMVSVGEYAETVRMMTGPLDALKKGLYRYLDDVKRRIKAERRGRKPRTRRAHVTSIQAIVAGLWLEKSYGWDPLTRDIDSGFGALTMIAQREYSKETYIVRSRGTSVGTGAWASQTMVGVGAEASARWRQNRRYDVGYIARISMEPRSFRGVVTESLGLTFGQFVPTIWELIPYSCVIDNVVNFNDIINAVSLNTSRIDWIVKTTRSYAENRLEEIVLSDWGTVGNIKFTPRKPRAVYRKGTFTRELPTSLDIPSLEFHKPSGKQLLNWLALVRTSRMTEKLITQSLINQQNRA